MSTHARSIRRRRARLGLSAAPALGLLATVGATSAMAGTLAGSAASPSFVAAPGETNNLRVTQQANGVSEWDDDRDITAVPPTACWHPATRRARRRAGR